MSVFKSFPQSNLIKEWDKLLKLSKEEVVVLYEEWKVIHKENEETYRRLYAEKFEKINEVSDYLKSKGIDVYKYKTKNFFKEKNGYQTWFKNNVVDAISKKYPYYGSGIPTAHMETYEINGIKISNNQSPTNIVELHANITSQYNSKIKEVQKVDKLLIKSIEYATKNNIDIEVLDHKDIIQIVNDFAKTKHLEENCPVGSEVYLKHGCYECNTYIVGEHRCSCGNRRVYIEVEGNIIEGFYHYPEVY